MKAQAQLKGVTQILNFNQTNQTDANSLKSSNSEDLGSMVMYRSPLVTISVTTKYSAFITDMIMNNEEDAKSIKHRLQEPSLVIEDTEKLSTFSCIAEKNRVSLIHFGNERAIKLLMIYLYRYEREHCIASTDMLIKFNINQAILKARPGEPEYASITGIDKLILAIHHAFLCVQEEKIEISPQLCIAHAFRLAYEMKQGTQLIKVDMNRENQSIMLRSTPILEEVDDDDTILDLLPRTTDPVRFLPDPFATLHTPMYLSSVHNNTGSVASIVAETLKEELRNALNTP